jgi:hypothetical protein
VLADGSFVDIVRSLKFDTTNADMVFYPLCLYVGLKTSDALYCIINDELMSMGTLDEQASIKTDYPYLFIDPFTSTFKDEVLSFKCLDANVKSAKNIFVLPKDQEEINFSIFNSPVYDVMFEPSTSTLLDVQTTGVATITGNNLNIKVTDTYTVVNVKVKLSDLFGFSIKGERLEFDCIIIKG